MDYHPLLLLHLPPYSGVKTISWAGTLPKDLRVRPTYKEYWGELQVNGPGWMKRNFILGFMSWPGTAEGVVFTLLHGLQLNLVLRAQDARVDRPHMFRIHVISRIRDLCGFFCCFYPFSFLLWKYLTFLHLCSVEAEAITRSGRP